MGRTRAGGRRRAAPRRAVVAAVAGAVLVAGVATTVVVTASDDPGPAREAAALDVPPGPMRGSTLSPVVSARIAAILGRQAPVASVSTAASSEPSEPVRVEIPAIGVDAGVVPISAPDRALLPPSDPDLLGWWSEGAEPGARTGSALITGHSVHTGGGALQDLADVGRGDEVVVETEAGRVEYAVVSTEVLDKPALAREAPDLFSQEAEGRVVLITCADWNGAEWLSNTVVTAEPL